MSGTTWTKFYWSDWDTDPALRLCSFAAQGLWMRMLCIASAHDPIGYVAVAGRALDETSIARMTGGLESEVRDLLGELDQNGVFSRDRHGRIYSRRMIADAKRAAIARKNGKNGGNPSLGKTKGNPGWDNPPVKGCLKPQEPEAIYQKEKPPLVPLDLSEAGSALTRAKRGTRIAEDWFPSAENISYAINMGFSPPAINLMAEKFANYWRAKSGASAVKLNWDATWRNWVLSEVERLPAAAPRKVSGALV